MAARKAPASSLTTAGLMHLLKVKHKQTIYKLIHQGMPFTVTGRAYRFDQSAVIAFLRLTAQKKLKGR